MPEISRFYGIVIRMFVEGRGRHHRAHFHAYYQGQGAVYAIDDFRCLGGALAVRQERLVLAWAEIHRRELEANWRRLEAGMPAARIEPLR